jgi:hypothetical protein
MHSNQEAALGTPPGDDFQVGREEPLLEPAPQGDEVVSRALGWSLAGLAVVGVLCLFGWLLFAPVTVEDSPFTPPDDAPPIADVGLPAEMFPDLPFTDITKEAGIDFVHFNGVTGELLMPEPIGSGCAFFDYDNDGDQDILFVNSSYVPGHEKPQPAPTMALYQNDGRGHFGNVTAGSGLEVALYGMGVACGDYDGDGLTDVFITAVGPNRLFRNLGGGRFDDVTAKAGVAGESQRWSSAAGFFDYNNDGRLDLFVCNYVDWSEELDAKLDSNQMGIPDYLQPWLCRGTQNYLYRNNGDGTFADVSRAAGIHVVNPASGLPKGKGLGVVFYDLDNDGFQDIVVANDSVQTFLFHNQRNGTFREIGEAAGIGNDHNGLPLSGMGIDLAYLHDDDRVTVGVGNVDNKATAMFLSQSDHLHYTDAVPSFGIAAETMRYTTWGLFFFDCDLDGRLDMFQSNGSINSREAAHVQGKLYDQPCQVFWNCGPGQPIRLAPLPLAKRSPAIEQPRMARGASCADIDGDGDLDVLVTQNRGPALLLRNDQRSANNYLRLKLVGDGGNREAIGARVEDRVAGRLPRNRVDPTRSYCSQVELPVTFGLGNNAHPDEVRVVWPDGSQQEVSDVKINGLTVVRKSTESKR